MQPKPNPNYSTGTVGVAFALAGATAAAAGAPYSAASTVERPSVMDQKTAADTITVTHALLDAKLEVVEARTDTKFAQLMGEIKLLGVNVLALGGQITDLKTDISNVKTEITGVKTATAGVKWNIMAAGLTLGGLIIALAAFGTQILDLAMSLISAK